MRWAQADTERLLVVQLDLNKPVNIGIPVYPCTEIPSPEIDNWYEESLYGYQFRVIAFDERSETILTQYLDGSLEEYDFETWYNMEPMIIPRPRAWMAPFEEIDDEWGILPLSEDIDEATLNGNGLGFVEGIDNIIDDIDGGWTDQATY